LKALREIGFGKALRYGCFTLLMVLYRAMIFPQLRVLFLRILGAKIGSNVIVHRTAFFNGYHAGFRELRIGSDCFIGDDCLIDLYEGVVMADSVTLAERVLILTHTNVGYRNHPLQGHFPPVAKPVSLKHGSFIGANATILPGVEVGECAFVAAGSVVTEDVPEWTLVGGVPARVIRTLSGEDQPDRSTH